MAPSLEETIGWFVLVNREHILNFSSNFLLSRIANASGLNGQNQVDILTTLARRKVLTKKSNSGKHHGGGGGGRFSSKLSSKLSSTSTSEDDLRINAAGGEAPRLVRDIWCRHNLNIKTKGFSRNLLESWTFKTSRVGHKGCFLRRKQNILNHVLLHRGPWKPDPEYDLILCVPFLFAVTWAI